MPKSAGGFIVVVVAWSVLGSCLPRPDKRAPRLPQPVGGQALPATGDCVGQDASIRSECASPSLGQSRRMHDDTAEQNENDAEESLEESDAPSTTELEPLTDDRKLHTINVTASCHNYGCLYRSTNEEYFLRCEIEDGGCRDGFKVEAKSAINKGLPRVVEGRSRMCGTGEKTVAALSGGDNIKLACDSDKDNRAVYRFGEKTAEFTLRKEHLEGRLLCVTTRAGKGQQADFGAASFAISPGGCAAAEDGYIRFDMQLEFSWR